MKYIGLQAALRNDHKVEKLLAKYGSAGFGAYIWLILAVGDKVTPKNPWCKVEYDHETTALKLKIDEFVLFEMMDYMVRIHLLEHWHDEFYCPRVLKYADKAFRNDVSNVDEISDLLVSAYRDETLKSVDITIENSKGIKSKCHLVPQGVTSCHKVSEGGPKEEKRKEDKRKEVEVKEVQVSPTATSTHTTDDPAILKAQKHFESLKLKREGKGITTLQELTEESKNWH